RPTTIPQLLDELKLEQAIAREALRLAFIQHKQLAVGLKGIAKERTLSDVFSQESDGSLINMMELDLLVGSGGVLSHAPRRQQSMQMMIDAFQPEGVTRLAVDSIFMMPHLGVLSTVNETAATEVFEKDCMIYLGTCVAPRGKGKKGNQVLSFEMEFQDGRRESGTMNVGDLRHFPLGLNETAKLRATPAKGWDLGHGSGKPVEAVIHGGVVGIVLDTRGRPIQFAADRPAQIADTVRWNKATDQFPV
ncbi:MAG TPA: glutamate mutase L, partial [Candidatus Latescibacteria bacterium]|nr:glutamate mutase L [Candidatus Latescibacterota bacterium]